LFFTLTRLGSVLPSTKRCQDTDHILTRDRVNFSAEGLVITLLRTKTIQFGNRRLHLPLLKLDSVLCPVRAYTNSLRKLGGASCVPAFVFRDKGKFVWLTKQIFIRTFRSITDQFTPAGEARFTGHSFRRGGATWAFQAGVPGELIQVMGDWSSDAYKQYLEFSMENKLKLASLFSYSLL
jgi:integrase